MFTMMGSLSAFAVDLPMGDNFEAPKQLTVDLREWEDGRPYFAHSKYMGAGTIRR